MFLLCSKYLKKNDLVINWRWEVASDDTETKNDSIWIHVVCLLMVILINFQLKVCQNNTYFPWSLEVYHLSLKSEIQIVDCADLASNNI
jgi:hypothetical protein